LRGHAPRRVFRLRRLKALVLLGEAVELAPLYDMKNLRFVLLRDEDFEKIPEQIQALEKALPKCVVAKGKICLGSGWILLLLPTLALAWLLGARRRKKLRPGSQHA